MRQIKFRERTRDIDSYTVIKFRNTDDVAQLIGVDKDGDEIYEGDTVAYPVDGEIHTASFDDFKAIREGDCIRCAR